MGSWDDTAITPVVRLVRLGSGMRRASSAGDDLKKTSSSSPAPFLLAAAPPRVTASLAAAPSATFPSLSPSRPSSIFSSTDAKKESKYPSGGTGS
ncbi:MAG: hypothetical protein CSA65_03250 [Proteobacteria bacterium]|nr:MAG: hypothetical protein CSA65_03250 [Pseudomonadota bacterium]